MKTGRQRVFAALRSEAVDSSPVWLMRQAGRYLPEYRNVRSEHSFLELVRSPALCTEVALQPLRRYDLDATIVFSDILVIPDVIGAGLTFSAGDGPRIEHPVRSDAAFDALDFQQITSRLHYVYEAVAQLRTAAPDHALFGFVGAPWTLYCYLVEGEGGHDFATARAQLWQQPELSRRLLEHLTDAVISHARAQLDAGADIIQIFDTWGGLLPAADYCQFVLPCLRRLADALAGSPTLLFVRGGGHLLKHLASLPFSAFSLDATMDVAEARRILGRTTQGNLDNVRLLGGEAPIRQGVAAIHAALGGSRNHIYNLGHGILPKTPPEAVQIFVDAVRSLR